ncbi:MAG: hypothetical protein Q4P08_03945 [Eubacteriales bacterium]|nr:hypothetical protein [Eubacteriales bacterium]
MATYTHTIDAKGRVIVPARLRNALTGVLYLTKSLDPDYLAVYNEQSFNELRLQLEALSGTDPNVRILRRELLGEAIACNPDSQGRISVDDGLWQQIGVSAGDEICFIDMFGKLEICAKTTRDKAKAEGPSLSEIDLSAYNLPGV